MHHVPEKYRIARSLLLIPVLSLLLLPLAGSSLEAQEVSKPQMPGVRNLAKLETTVACAGAIDAAQAVPAIKKEGFVAIINLRQATEPDANVEREEALAKEAGLRYFHVPFNGASPDPKAADAFLAAITTPGAEPAFIHCSGGNRAATMWMIKRMVVDKWDAERATKEAMALGQTSAPLRQFAIEYANTHQR
jgi:uncharacterized protein (TIGR01244 family)